MDELGVLNAGNGINTHNIPILISFLNWNSSMNKIKFWFLYYRENIGISFGK